MPLSKRKKEDGKEEALPPGIVNRLQLSPYRVLLAGVETWKVQHVALHKDITTVGFVEFNERELKHVAARVKARISKLYVNETGQFVHADEALASLYSSELIVTVQNLIDANRARNTALEDSTRERLRVWGINDKQMDMVIAVQNQIDGMRKTDPALRELAQTQMQKLANGAALGKSLHDLLEAQRTSDGNLMTKTRPQLVKLGMHDDQIDDILETGKAIKHLIIRSPIQGHVLKKYVKEGQYVDEGSPLYDVVDLTSVWIQAQVYEDDMAFLPTMHQPLKNPKNSPKSLQVKATTRGLPNEAFEGWLSFVYPHVDQDTRTVVARFELDNPGHKLRPGTSATVEFKVPPTKLPAIAKAINERWSSEIVVDRLRFAFAPAGEWIGLYPLARAANDHANLRKGLVLAVPETSVIDTGNQKIVYREILPGEYEGVSVTLGPRLVNTKGVTFYPVLRGLEADDVVVTSGSFLVDAETRLNPAAGSIYFGGSGGSKSGAGVISAKPSLPADPDAKVKAALDKLSDADRRLADAQGTCPIQRGSRLGSMGVPVKLVLHQQPVFICCSACEPKAKGDPTATLKQVDDLKNKVSVTRTAAEQEAEIRAELAKLSPADQVLARAQKWCPASGFPLGTMGVPPKHMIQGQPVFVCCDNCDARVLADPAKTIQKVNEFKKKAK
jgi:Cu(I)/Ag(I) efflux system membrane fusion protein